MASLPLGVDSWFQMIHGQAVWQGIVSCWCISRAKAVSLLDADGRLRCLHGRSRECVWHVVGRRHFEPLPCRLCTVVFERSERRPWVFWHQRTPNLVENPVHRALGWDPLRCSSFRDEWQSLVLRSKLLVA